MRKRLEMKYDFETALVFAVKNSIEKESLSGYKKIDLSEDEINLLYQKIKVLPEEATALILGKYYFELKTEDIEVFYNTEDVEKKLIHYESILSYSMGLGANNRISKTSMKKVSRKISTEIVTGNWTIKESKAGYRTHSLKKTLKIILIAAIIMALSISTVLAFNKDFRERVVSWFIEKHNEYSLMSLETENGDDNLEPVTEELMSEYVPEYIPKDMPLEEQFKGGIVSYTYASDDNTLDIILSEPDQYAYLNTEKKILKEIKVNDKKAFWFEDETEGNLCFNKDGIFIYIHGNLSQDVLIKVAENIERKK